MTAKKVLSTMSVTLGLIFGATGFAWNLPNLLARHADDIPDLIRNPNTWWFVFIALLTVVAIAIIWLPWGQRPRHPQYPAYLPPEDQYVTDYRDRLFEHTQWLGKKRQYEQFAKVVNNELEIVLPVMLQANFGKKERNQFVLAVSEARKLSNDSAILFKVAMGQLDAMLIARRNRLCAEYQSQQSSNVPAQTTAP